MMAAGSAGNAAHAAVLRLDCLLQALRGVQQVAVGGLRLKLNALQEEVDCVKHYMAGTVQHIKTKQHNIQVGRREADPLASALPAASSHLAPCLARCA